MADVTTAAAVLAAFADAIRAQAIDLARTGQRPAAILDVGGNEPFVVVQDRVAIAAVLRHSQAGEDDGDLLAHHVLSLDGAIPVAVRDKDWRWSAHSLHIDLATIAPRRRLTS